MLSSSLTAEDKTQLLGLARRTLEAAFDGDSQAPLEDFRTRERELSRALTAPSGCFVSLFGPRRRLRGCIGRLESRKKLYENVAHLAVQAAFHDPRFQPVSREELAGLTLHVSVLGPTVPLPSLDQLEIGRHGLVVSNGAIRGVLLAEVATERGWTRETFLRETCHKAGLDPGGCDGYEIGYFEELHFAEERNPRHK